MTFFSRTQMLLLQTFMEFPFSKAEVLKELNVGRYFQVLILRSFGFPFRAIKPDLLKNIF